MDRNMSARSMPPLAPKRIVAQGPPQHDELIKFIHEAWHKVSREVDQGGRGGAVFYKSQVPEPSLAGFTPFDLEGWWGRRLVQNITNRGHP